MKKQKTFSFRSGNDSTMEALAMYRKSNAILRLTVHLTVLPKLWHRMFICLLFEPSKCAKFCPGEIVVYVFAIASMQEIR